MEISTKASHKEVAEAWKSLSDSKKRKIYISMAKKQRKIYENICKK